MPKKAATARNGAQRTRPKAQKSFELVRPESVTRETEENAISSTSTATAVATQPELETSVEAATPIVPQPGPKASAKVATKVTTSSTSKASNKAATSTVTSPEPDAQESQTLPPAGSASARLAARRQAAQRMQQRAASTLITSEHFAYVRKDLMRIALFAVIMFTAIIVLYLTLGRA